MNNDAYLIPVADRIAGAIVEFCVARAGDDFHADDLRAFVRNRCGRVAPASADRVLRHLRRVGRLDYTVVSRANSLYHCNWADDLT